MKYEFIKNTDHIPDERSWYYDDCGNRVDKETGDYVILVIKTKDDVLHSPMTLKKVNNEWVPKQMEFDFE